MIKRCYICPINIEVPHEVKNLCAVTKWNFQRMKWIDVEYQKWKWYLVLQID